jgi:hypothetical protein
MDRFFFLDAVEDIKGGGAASNFGDIGPMLLESICIARERKGVRPSDPVFLLVRGPDGV